MGYGTAFKKCGSPVASDYIHQLFDDFMEFAGDRYFKDDGAIVGGIAYFHGMPVTVIGRKKVRIQRITLNVILVCLHLKVIEKP